MKKLIFLTILLLCLSSFFHTAFAQQEIFSGTRNVILTADMSDVDNFISGGRSELDVILRQSIPEFANLNISSKGRDLKIAISFSFSSYEDYKQKVEQLINSGSVIVYNNDKGVFLMENFGASAFLNFTEPALEISDNTFEKRIDEIFDVTENKITLNEKTYSSYDDKMTIRPESDEKIEKFKKIGIAVFETENGFSGSICAQVDSAVYDFEKITMDFKACGEVELNETSGNVKDIEVFLKADTQQELMEKIMKCLNTSISVREEEMYVNDKTVGVNRTDAIDVTPILEENGHFTYAYTYPSYFKNIAVDETTASLVDTVIENTDNSSTIKYYYERGLKFKKIEVNTDFSNNFGKIKKNITFVLPINLATKYNNTIKDQFSEHMIKGTVFEIKDEGFDRYYTLSYSSWFVDDIVDFASGVLKTKQLMNISDSWLPYGKSEITEIVKVGKAVDNMLDPQQLVVSYTFAKSSKIYPNGKNGEWLVEGNKATISVGDNYISISYQKFNLLKIIVVFTGLLILIIAIFLIVRRNKKPNAQVTNPTTALYYVYQLECEQYILIGAFEIYEDAKKLADENKEAGYQIFDEYGNILYDPLL